MIMEDWAKHLDGILISAGENLLVGNGSISHNQAMDKAQSEYKKYKELAGDNGGDFYGTIKERLETLQRENCCLAGIERLIKGYVDYLSGDELASTKFWEMEKRIKRDKKTPGVYIEFNKGNMMFDLIRLMKDGVITFDDLAEFSDELRENVKLLHERYG